MATEAPHLLLGLLLAALLGGCAGGDADADAGGRSTSTPGSVARSGPARLAASEMPPVERAERVQRVLRRQIGDAVRVGYVEQIAGGRVRVLGMDTFGLRAGASLLFLDANRQPIAYGAILEADSNRVVANADPTLVDGGRPPQPGDLAAFNLSEQSARRPS